jgi:hypothetical protein
MNTTIPWSGAPVLANKYCFPSFCICHFAYPHILHLHSWFTQFGHCFGRVFRSDATFLQNCSFLVSSPSRRQICRVGDPPYLSFSWCATAAHIDFDVHTDSWLSVVSHISAQCPISSVILGLVLIKCFHFRRKHAILSLWISTVFQILLTPASLKQMLPPLAVDKYCSCKPGFSYFVHMLRSSASAHVFFPCKSCFDFRSVDCTSRPLPAQAKHTGGF